MPIEIRELHIRVSVAPPPSGKPAGVFGPGHSVDVENRQAIVADCVEQVMETLRDQRER